MEFWQVYVNVGGKEKLTMKSASYSEVIAIYAM